MGQKLKGTFEKKNENAYLLRVTTGYNEKGNPKRLSKYIKAEDDREADYLLYKWIKELEDNGFSEPEKITLNFFYNRYWLKEAKQNLEQRAYEDYSAIIENRFLEPLGKKTLQDIKPYQIKELVISMKNLKTNKDLSRKTKKKALNALSNLFSVAIDEYRLLERNPVHDVKLPKEKGKKSEAVAKPYDVEEIKTLIKTLGTAGIRTQAIIMTAFITGAREGEIAALEEDNLDFENKQITFNQRLIQSKELGLIRVDGLKASDSKTMPVPSDYLELMKEFIAENKEDREALGVEPKHKYVFGTFDGNPVRPDSLYKHWKRFAEKNNLRPIRFHDLRHTTASYLISKPEIPIKAVQERLGHKDYRTTMNIYAHSIKEADEKASDAFSELLN